MRKGRGLVRGEVQHGVCGGRGWLGGSPAWCVYEGGEGEEVQHGVCVREGRGLVRGEVQHGVWGGGAG